VICLSQTKNSKKLTKIHKLLHQKQAMQNLNTVNTTGLSLELFHVQTNTSFDLPENLSVIRIGKPNDQNSPEINVLALPNADVVSRNHAQILVEGSNYVLEDNGSSNGTFINDIKLEPKIRYLLNLGDRIDLGKGQKVTFILQYKQENQNNTLVSVNPTMLQHEIAENNGQTKVDRTSKFVGLALMVAGFVLFSANTQLGIFVRIPSVLLCIAGVVVLIQRRINRNLGWVLIAAGIAFLVFTGNVFASVNLLATIISAALLFVGYKLFTTGKVLNYGLQNFKDLLKK
jgi:pSer/pThr/pTyr-binding forkhead associated (FHA) protein